MKVFETLDALADAAGTEIGTSDWHTIDQDRIDRFADVTGDHQWIHVDPERTRRELAMSTIAHGYLTLSLLPLLMGEIYSVPSIKRAINYGSNKVRFLNMVPVGSRIRGRLAVRKADRGEGTLRLISDVTVEIEGEDRPALVAETIVLYFD